MIVENTISNTIYRLKIASGIKYQLCSHMFRHRYITNFFIKLIKQYDLENKDDFRIALLDINTLKAHIQQVTGHTNVNLLDTYINLAKIELTNLNKIVDKVNDMNKKESIDKSKRELLIKLKNKEITLDEYIKEMEKL